MKETKALLFYITAFALVCVLNAAAAFASTTPSSWKDGEWTPGASPTILEVQISTTFPNMGGPDDYRKIVSDKAYIQAKAVEVDIQLQAYQDLQVRYPSLPLNSRIKKLTAQLDLLFAIYSSLP